MAGAIAAYVGIYGASPPPPPPGFVSVKQARRQLMQTGLMIHTANGRPYRWGGREPDAGARPGDLVYSSVIPGGDDVLTCTLRRRRDRDYADLERLNKVRVFGPGNETLWIGQLVEAPASSGDELIVTASAAGYQNVLKGKKARMIYKDVDLGRWTGPTLPRRDGMEAINFRTFDPAVVFADKDDDPSIETGFDESGGWGATSLPSAEAWYDSGGIPLGRLYVDWQKTASLPATGGNWLWQTYLADDALGAVNDSHGNLQAAGPGTDALDTAASSRLFAVVELFNAAAGGSASSNRRFAIYWKPAVYGLHSLTRRGPEPGGFYTTDILKDWLARTAPGIGWNADTIKESTRILHHCAFYDPTTGEAGVLEIAKLDQWPWGIYAQRNGPPEPLMFFKPWAEFGRTWYVREDEGAKLTDQGPQAEDLWQGVVVRFTDAAGVQRAAGPPGSGADFEFPELADTNPDNPLNAHGYDGVWKDVDGGRLTSLDARDLGVVALADLQQRETRGSCTVEGEVFDERGNAYPTAYVRAGDRMRVMTARDTSPRNIIKATYTDASVSVACDFDALPHREDAILAWLQSVQVGLPA